MSQLCFDVSGQSALVDQPDAQPGNGSGSGGGNSRNAATHDQHIAMRETFGDPQRSGLAGQYAQTCEGTNHRLEQRPSLAAWAAKGFVVKAGWQQRLEPIQQCCDVEARRWPCIDRTRNKAFDAEEARCECRSRRRADQSVWLVSAIADDTARAMVFETARDDTHAIGNQCCRQGLAAARCQKLPVENNGHGFMRRHIDQAITGHGTNRLVDVSRRNRIQRRHPCRCHHSSSISPLTLSRR